MSRFRTMLLFAAGIFIFSQQYGCFSKEVLTLKVNLKESKPFFPSGGFYAGAAKIDITPVPGYSMGGYAVSSRTSRGWWTRLYSRAIYLEDSTGTPLFLVSCDLWSIPGGLADIIAQDLQEELSSMGGPSIGRENIIIAATHTHHSPGNYSTSESYNSLSSHKRGFDLRLFGFLKHRIMESMIQAYKNKKRATMKVYGTEVYNVARNRSYPAFLYNPESRRILEKNKNIPIGKTTAVYPDSMAFRAVIPELKVLRFDPDPGVGSDSGKINDSVPIAIAAFFAVHPNSLGSMPEIYNSGLFGVSSTIIEQHFAEAVKGSSGGGYNKVKEKSVAALFNGAEGDVSPIWEKQDRQTTMKLGRILADSILNVIKRSVRPAAVSPMTVRFRRFRIADAFYTDSSGRKHYTDSRALPGDPLLGGAEDGRTFAHHLGFTEGIKGERTTEQGSKRKVFDNSLYPGIVADLVEKLIRTPLVKNAPKYIPVAICQMNDVVICTVPGEFTTVLGYRVVQTVRKSLEKKYPRANVFLIGLANEYLSYFTTPEEYEAQHYEGASTVYGPASGPLIISNLNDLLDPSASSFSAPAESNEYFCGETHSFGMSDCSAAVFNPDDGLENIAEDEEGNPKRDFPKCSWTDTELKLRKDSRKDIIPSITIQFRENTDSTKYKGRTKDKDGAWKTLFLNEHGIPADSTDTVKIPETDKGLNIVTVSSYDENTGEITWNSIWMVPRPLYDKMVNSGAEFRFYISRGKKRFISPGFSLNSSTAIQAEESREKIVVQLGD